MHPYKVRLQATVEEEEEKEDTSSTHAAGASLRNKNGIQQTIREPGTYYSYEWKKWFLKRVLRHPVTQGL